MKPMILLLTLSLALLASYDTHAAETTQLKVVGTIRPSACSIALDSAGNLDFGNILPSSLNNSTGTQLASKSIGLAIACDGLTNFALKVSDNRADSVVPGLAAVVSDGGDFSVGDFFALGLGKAGSKNIGVFMMSLSNSTSTTSNVLYRVFSRNLKHWNGTTSNFIPPSLYLAWNTISPSSTTYTYGALKDIKTTINVTPVIDKKINLPAGQQINLDGSVTLELVYL